jgi:acetyl-CoA synthetase
MPEDPYERARRAFSWRIPARYNLGAAVTDAWAERAPDRPAILTWRAGEARTTTFAALRDRSDRLALALRRRGISQGDRVAILLQQSAEVVIAHAAAAKLGALSLPLASVFGLDALAFRLAFSGARAIILDGGGLAKIAAIRDSVPALECILCVDGPSGEAEGLEEALAAEGGGFQALDTGPDDPAMMIFTSGTTGQPKGAVHAHRVLLGHLPGFAFAHHGFPEAGDLMWTPADWAWAGGLLNALMPSLSLGVPVVAWPHDKFDPEEALALVERLGVRNAFLPPTALRMLKAAHRPGQRYPRTLRSIMSAGEALGPETYEWAFEAFGRPVDELYGQTECNLVLGSSSALGVSRAGFTGRPVPGHTVLIVDEEGRPSRPGEAGEIVVRRPDPVMFLAYWQDEAATAAKFRGDLMLTGDRALVDADGYVRFLGRDDDIITSSGYRIGPGEIEDCLARHPAIAYAAAIGKPDALRTEIVKAFVVLKPGHAPSAELSAELQAFVRHRLSAHEYPREIDYVDALPLTATGKIIRRALRERG